MNTGVGCACNYFDFVQYARSACNSPATIKDAKHDIEDAIVPWLMSVQSLKQVDQPEEKATLKESGLRDKVWKLTNHQVIGGVIAVILCTVVAHFWSYSRKDSLRPLGDEGCRPSN